VAGLALGQTALNPVVAGGAGPSNPTSASGFAAPTKADGSGSVVSAVPTGWPKNVAADEGLLHASPTTPVKVMIQFSSTPNSGILQAINTQGGAQNKSFSQFKGGVFTLPANLVPVIAKLPGIKYVSVDRPIHRQLDITTATVGANIARTYGWTGKGIGVAVLDSGITPGLADLNQSGTQTSRVVYRENFIDGNTGDNYGHGTHVAGIIGGNGSSSSGFYMTKTYRGVATQVNLIDLRVLDSNGAGSDSAVIAAIERAIQLKNTYNIRVINLSLGRPIYESFQNDPLCQAVEMAWQAGITVVVAAGNNGRDNSVGNQGYATIGSPANDPYVITVGAMNAKGTSYKSDDVITSYSSKGPTIGDHIVKPDIVAPGNHVVSLRAPSSLLDTTGNRVNPATYGGSGSPVYLKLNGTSMAAPVVSGAVALLLQQNPNLTPDQIKARLMLTASKTFPAISSVTDNGVTYTDYYDIFTIGAGYLCGAEQPDSGHWRGSFAHSGLQQRHGQGRRGS
jgi:serine protease AprX